jgi:hypothetical protein
MSRVLVFSYPPFYAKTADCLPTTAPTGMRPNLTSETEYAEFAGKCDSQGRLLLHNAQKNRTNEFVRFRF